MLNLAQSRSRSARRFADVLRKAVGFKKDRPRDRDFDLERSDSEESKRFDLGAFLGCSVTRPREFQALSAEYSINVRLLHGDLAETISQNILELPDPEQFDKTLRDLQQLRSKYDTAAATTPIIPAPERPFQEFPTVVAMAAQEQPTE